MTAARPLQCVKCRSLVALLAVAVLSSGCVSRRMTIVSDPPGALAYVDNYEIGTTPVSTDFIYYGKRQVRLVKDGYETVTVEQPVWAPWYQWFPLDFITENLIPWEIRDERTFRYSMQPQTMVPGQQLLSRADSLRASTQSQALATTPITESVVPAATMPEAQSVAPATTVPPAGVYAPQGQLPPPSNVPYAAPSQGPIPPNQPYGGTAVPSWP